MKLKRQSDGLVFEFNFNNIGYAMWVMELQAVGDDRRLHSYSDPISSEREARAYARRTLESWYHDDLLGWCQRSGEEA